MRVTIEISEATDGKFSDLILSYIGSENIQNRVSLNLKNYVNIYDFIDETKSVKFDFFLISALVYGVDNLLSREEYSDDGWAREIEVKFPVYNLEKWMGNETLFEEALNFLTGDTWNISFGLNEVENVFIEKKRRWHKNIKTYEKEKIKSISLFSGGLDSLIGIIDELESLENDEKILLVSHFDFKSSGPNKDQRLLYNALIEKYANQIYWVQTKLALNRKTQNDNRIKIESNYRSRSLFFIGLGVYLSTVDKLIIPENGTISINYPLTPSRVSSLSTRTTHPIVLNKLQQILNNCEINLQLINPYSFDTKGEMFVNCKNQEVLKHIYEKSVSCGKRGRKQYWNHKTGTDHCGVCMPCVYRRSALNKAVLDNQLYGSDITDAPSKNSFKDLPALFSYLNKNISIEQMKTDLVINGSIPFEELNDYADMVLRSKAEVLKLFTDKGNEFVKYELGQI
jgi:hypothetical protein